MGVYTDGGCEALQFGVTIAELHVTISPKVTHGNIVSKYTFFATKTTVKSVVFSYVVPKFPEISV